MNYSRNISDYPILIVLKLFAFSCSYAPLGHPLRTDANQPPLDASSQFSSCADLPRTCGAAYESCCQAEMVPGTDLTNTFYRNYDVAGDMMFSDPGYPAKISTFVLDRYEATVGRFRAFVNARMGTQENPPKPGSGAHLRLGNSGWDSIWNMNLATDTVDIVMKIKCTSSGKQYTWTDTPGLNENKPINCVTWYEALAFCIWDGGYLPTEAEWNYAASGGSEQRAFPWSNPPDSLTINCTYTNYYPCSGSNPTAANLVGSESPRGDGRWKHSDLAGNIYEWVLDWNAPLSPIPTCDDCANLNPSSERALRGGLFDSPASDVRSAYRRGYGIAPDKRFIGVGFRCARNSL